GVLGMDVKTATDVGRLRENNEDALWVGEHCLVVCDGMGGHVAGEVAAELAIEAIKSFPFGAGEPAEEVLAAIDQAQNRIIAEANRNTKYQGMGSTITLAWVSAPGADGERELVVGHVGDSRCYLFTNGVLEQLTSDHSVVGEMVRAGTITPLEARNHPQKHILTQVLGSAAIQPELIVRRLRPGSIILLCTDGLTDVVDDTLLEKTLQQDFYANNLAQELVDLANELGGPDNITVIVAKV
ncbi:MAG TPA: protein phosphatase 2C domain-containing protein, partial [Limnochordia bacterium]|nr:protein phosphatase 2C domain-containing protein [Limnochordia bacterium]